MTVSSSKFMAKLLGKNRRSKDKRRSRYRLEALEDRRLLVIGAFEIPPLVELQTGFDGVVALDFSNSSTPTILDSGCTGALLSTGRHILTAAHCVDDDGDGMVDPDLHFQVVFEMAGQHYVINIDSDVHRIALAPGWTGDTDDGADLAIIELPVIAPFPAERYEIYRGDQELNSLITIVGYGNTGTGTLGQIDGGLATKRIGFNEIGDIDALAAGDVLQYDFDDGNLVNNTLGDSLGLGDSEAITGTGDSGGPWFIDGALIAAVTSFGGTAGFGDVDNGTRVSQFAGFVDTELAMAADIVLDMNFQPAGNDGVPDEIVARRDPADSDRLQLLIAGQVVWSDELSRVTSLTIIGSGDDDTFTLDGDFEIDVAIEGGLGFDSLVLIGDGLDDAVYTPSATTTGDGTVVIDADTITFTGLEPLVVSAMATYTLTTPNSDDLVLVANAGVGRLIVSGTSGGVVFESVTFFDIPVFTIDTATNDAGAPNDIITLQAPNPATGLTTFNITTGAGTDRLVYQGSALGDTFQLATTLTASNAAGPLLTVDALTDVEEVTLHGQAGDDVFLVDAPQPFDVITLSGDTGEDIFRFNGTGDDEVINLFAHPADPTRAVLFRDTGVDTVTVEVASLEQVDINAGDGADRIVVGRTNTGDSGAADAPTSPYTDPTAILRDLTATGIVAVNVDVGAADAAADAVFVDGRNDDDHLTISLEEAAPSTVLLAGLAYDVRVRNSTTDDRLTVRGNAGNDVIKSVNPTGGGTGSVESVIGITLAGGQGNDVLSADAILIGGIGDDFLEGGAGDDMLFGNEGNDTMIGLGGDDTFDGGAGFDTILIRGTPGDDQIDVNQTDATTLLHTVNGDLQTDTLVVDTVEGVRVEAGEGADLIRATISDALFDDPGLSLRMTILGGPDGDADRLGIVDDGTADLTLQRKTQNNDTGSATIGPGNDEPFHFVYEGVEQVQFIRPAGSRLVVFKHDPFETNDDRFTATHLGAGSTINVDPTIDPGFDPVFAFPGDEDWYRVEAEATGTLDFQVFFQQIAAVGGRPGLPGDGDLSIEVYDADGTLITGFGVNDDDDDERIRIPAVQGQVYFLRVFGAGADSPAINAYSLTVINTPAPVPYGLELDDALIDGIPPDGSDTGRSQFDNVTNDNTPTIFFRLDDAFFLQDLPGNPAPDAPPDEIIPIAFQSGPAQPTMPGFAIAIFDEGPVPPATQLPQIPLGFATNAGDLNNNGIIDGGELFIPGVYKFTTPLLSDGSHFLSARVQMIDPADPTQTGFGARSLLLEVIVDTSAPPVVFGDPTIAEDGLIDESGVIEQPDTFNDNKTNDRTPEFWGTAEANSIIRLFVDANDNGVLDGADVQIAETVAQPLDGTNQAIGRWRVESDVNLNNPALVAALGLDGLRRIFVTAEDLAGNENPVVMGDQQTLEIFLDTQGPQVTGVFITMFEDIDLFAPKGADGGPVPTPPVTMLSINFQDLPNRVAPNFLNPFANLAVVVNPAHFRLVGDNVGLVPIVSVTITSDVRVPGMPATGTVKLTFAEALPDDRYTLTISDEIVDDAGNPLDGENSFAFPSGDGQPGTDFVTRFTIDTRAEIGSWAGGSVYLDLNGNLRFDPDNPDPANRDVTHTLGLATDYVFAGKFVLGPGGTANGFDGLATYGRSGGRSQWQIDTTGDGVPDLVVQEPPGFNPTGQPVAGNFDGNAANGDEVGLFTGTHLLLDTNHDFMVDTVIPSNLRGLPIVGDFDGDGQEDFGTYSINTGVFQLSLSGSGGGITNPNVTTTFRIQFNSPFIGGRERPVAGDMNGDGADDIGLWVPDRRGVTPRGTAEWYFLLSRDTDGDGVFNVSVPARIVNGVIPFTPEPFSDDLFARFGDEFALPVVGNFDPPGTPASPVDRTSPQINSGNDFLAIGADAGSSPNVRLVDRATGTTRLEFAAYAPGFRGGVRVATADFNGDGVDDIITGAGPGGGPHVRVFDGRTGAPLSGAVGSFFAFDPRFTGGIFVAAGDVDGDQQADIIVSAGAGGGPHVRVFSGRDGSLLGEFFAYSPQFRGGVHVAAGDIDGDGRAEIITGAGPGGGPHVRVFENAQGQQVAGPIGSFMAYDVRFRGGVFVAAGDVDGDQRAEVITGAGPGGGPHVRVFRSSDGAEVAGFFAYANSFTGGVRVATTDFNGDGRVELSLAAAAGNANLRIVDFRGQSQLASFGSASSSGAFVASPQPAQGPVTALAAPSAPTPPSPTPGPVISTPQAHDQVLSTWNSTPSTDDAVDALMSPAPPPSLGSGSQVQNRLRAALFALL